MHKHQIVLSCLLLSLSALMPSREEATIFLLSLALVPSQLEGINLNLDLECVSKTIL